MLVNKSLELQKIIILAINSIDYLNDNAICAYTTIPLKVKLPYIKLYSISSNVIDNVKDLQRITFDFFVATNGKTNKQLLEIMEAIYTKLPDKINEINANINSDIKIYNIFNVNFNITEDIKNDIWYGHYVISIDV